MKRMKEAKRRDFSEYVCRVRSNLNYNANASIPKNDTSMVESSVMPSSHNPSPVFV